MSKDSCGKSSYYVIVGTVSAVRIEATTSGKLELHTGGEDVLLLTTAEYSRARLRAKSNPASLPGVLRYVIERCYDG